MNDTNCPYCGAEVEINHDDGYGMDENEIHQQECWKCEKTFTYTISISIDHYPEKADCLNGEAHQLELTATYPPEFARMRCKDCGHEEQSKP